MHNDLTLLSETSQRHLMQLRVFADENSQPNQVLQRL